MNKKKILLISGGLLTLVLIIISIVLITNNNEEKIYTTNKRKENVNNFLTLMLEQSDGTYKESTSNTWPGEGYIFNKELSSCQNGGELDYDSENNKVILYSNKSDGCYVYFDLYTKPTINSINLGEVTNNSITITVSATNGTNPISNYYYIINDGVPISTTSNTHTFSGLDRKTTYTIKVYVVDTEDYSSNISTLSVETDNATLLAEYITNTVYLDDGINGLYYHDGQGSYTNADQEAGDNSYRYSGANPNNYVCFGSDDTTCPNDNLYRIIGVFDKNVKIIKNTNYGNYIYDSERSYSLLSILNSTFLNTLDIIWQEKIYTQNFNVVARLDFFMSTVKTSYDLEYGSTSYKIGLMYPSDYGYAASPNYWQTKLNDYDNAINSNWLYTGLNEWTISTMAGLAQNAGYIFSSGGVANTLKTTEYAVRPVFYLNSDVTYVSGTGTQSDPFRIA